MWIIPGRAFFDPIPTRVIFDGLRFAQVVAFAWMPKWPAGASLTGLSYSMPLNSNNEITPLDAAMKKGEVRNLIGDSEQQCSSEGDARYRP